MINQLLWSAGVKIQVYAQVLEETQRICSVFLTRFTLLIIVA